MKTELKLLPIIIIMLFSSCNGITIMELLERELGIKLSDKITLVLKEDIDFGFTGDFINLRVYNIKECYYKEIEQAAINKEFIYFDETNPLPYGNDIFYKYIKEGSGMYKFYNKNEDYSECELIVINEKTKVIIYYFIHN